MLTIVVQIPLNFLLSLASALAHMPGTRKIKIRFFYNPIIGYLTDLIFVTV